MPPVLIDPDTGQEFEDLYDPDEFAQDSGPDIAGAAWEGISNIPSGIWDTISGGASAIWEGAQKYPGLDPAVATGAVFGDRLNQNRKAIAPTVAGLGSAAIGVAGSPLAGALSVPTLQYGAQRINDYFWPEDAQTPNQQAEQLARDISGTAVTYGAGQLVPRAIDAVNEGINNNISPWIQKNSPAFIREQNDWRYAQREGSTANVLDAGRGQTGRELQIVEDIKPYEDTFRQMAPYKGITNKPGQSAVQTMRDNLAQQKEAALMAKRGVLDAADAAGQGLALDDLDLSGMNKYDPSTFSEGAPFVRKKIIDAFAEGPKSEWERAMGISNPKRLTANDIQGLVREIDDEIAKLGGYDDILISGADFDPSKLAQRKQHLGALRTARTTLNNALNKYAGSTLGVENPLGVVNDRISTAIEYDPLMQRFYNSVGQGDTPGSVRSMTGPQMRGSSLLKDPTSMVIDKATGGFFDTLRKQQTRATALDADFNAVDKLQRYAQMHGALFETPDNTGMIYSARNWGNDKFQAVMDRLAPILPGLLSIDPMTGLVNSPQERALLASHVSNMNGIDMAQKFEAMSDINAGRLPGGAKPQPPPPPELPSIDSAYNAALNAAPTLERFGPPTEDELLMQQLDYFASTDYDSSGL